MKLEPTRPEGCLSDLALDELMLGELDAEAVSRAHAHVDRCGRCGARLGELEGARRAFGRATFPGLARPTSPRAARSGLRRHLRLALPLAGGLAAAAAILLSISTPDAGPETLSGTRSKGGPRLGLFVQHEGQVREGKPGEVVFPGDVLRFTYTSPEPRYLGIVSVDGAGAVTVYHPAGARLEKGRAGDDQPLPDGIELDAVLGTEHVYGFFCSAPLEVTVLKHAVSVSARDPHAPRGCHVDHLKILKRAR